jgi:hypothetical protein
LNSTNYKSLGEVDCATDRERVPLGWFECVIAVTSRDDFAAYNVTSGKAENVVAPSADQLISAGAAD